MIPLLALGLLACQPRVECSAEQPCELGSVCIEGRCVAQHCATSVQCGMEQYCSGGQCVDGCEQDEDCYPGDACDTDSHTCVPAACEDAHRDCAFGEFCNAATGECYEAPGPYCAPCVTDEDCGGGDNHCTSYGYCGVSCWSDADCPAGYDCIPFVDLNGNVQYYQCFTYCWLYEDGSAAREVSP